MPAEHIVTCGRFAGVHRCAVESSLLCQAGAMPDMQMQERKRWRSHAIHFNVKLFARPCVGCAGAFGSVVGALGCHV